ncbi:WD40 repeat domain-containing protein, partial [Roseiflexus sp.]
MTFSPDGQMLLSGGADGTTRLWNVGDGREIRRFAGH